MQVSMKINGATVSHDVEPRTLLVHFIRENAGLTGTNIGCDSSSCGACTIHIDGEAVKSCTVFAVQADGSDVRTVEGLAGDSALDPVQAAFWEHQGLQCGFCTPGMLMTAHELLERNPTPVEEETREALSGNMCRCTG